MRYFLALLLTASISTISSSYILLRFTQNCVPPSLFKCRSGGQCIQAAWVCDGDNDCIDSSDEDRSMCSNKTCGPLQMQCNNSGRCIPRLWLCDNENDCSDGSDESPQLCSDKQVDCKAIGKFECSPGVCIPISWKCDGSPDCSSQKDEENCQEECQANSFKCNDGYCIDSSWVCDGDGDCSDGSDEINCHGCRIGEFQCKDKSCVPKRWRCDGEDDCLDKSDEENCTRTGSTSPRPTDCTQFLCPDRITCISHAWVCDGKDDCPEGEEESPAYCKNITCRSDEFKCLNNQCVSGSVQCDGNNDCSDGSDENDCGTIRPPCEDDEFDCGDSLCIPLKQVCDGIPHCPESEDEPGAKCNVNECLRNNGGCSQICVDTAIDYFCKCRDGFQLVGNSTCYDIDECEDPASCSQICINEKGTFKCECLDGYVKETDDHRRCKAIDSNSTLIVSRRHDIREVSVQHKRSRVIVNETKSAIALDMHIEKGLIFYSDAIEHKIFKAHLNNNEAPIVIVEQDSTLCDGLAVDWIYNHIYWTDSVRDSIVIGNLDGKMRKSIIIDNLDKPRAIALNPLDGWMYWSDWGIKPKIERAGMDGTHRSTIVSHDVQWPNGITLDLVKHRLYWIDAKLDMISSVNFDGSLRRTVLHSTLTVLHPFSIAVFEDYIYWTDWAKRGLFQANKFNGSNVKAILEPLSSLMVVHVNHPFKQPNGTNYCKEMKCSHICLPAPRINKYSAKVSCACPNGLYLLENGLQCSSEPPNVTTTPTNATPRPNSTSIPEESTSTIPPKLKVTTHEPELPQTTDITTENSSLHTEENSPLHKEENSRPDSSNNSIDLSKNMLLNSEVAENSTKKYIILGVFIMIAVCLAFLSLLYYGYNRYYKVSQRAVNIFQPNYSKMSDEKVSLTKEDYNEPKPDYEESSSSQSCPNANYDNYLY